MPVFAATPSRITTYVNSAVVPTIILSFQVIGRLKLINSGDIVMVGVLMGAGAAWGEGKRADTMSCFLDDLRPFDINDDQWTTTAQDRGEGRKTVEHGAGRFMVIWIVAAEEVKAGLWHAVVCPNLTGRPRRG